MISLSQISHAYTVPHWVLRDLTISFEPQQRVLLLGANGCGKTTLLKIISQQLTPTHGALKLNGQLGVVSTDSFVYAELSAFENLRLYARLYNLSEDRLRWAARSWGMEAFWHQPTRTLSQGQLKRLSLARGTFHQPTVLCMDEPSNALDAEGLGLLEAYLQDFSGLAIIATHDPESLSATATHRLRFHADHRLEWE